MTKRMGNNATANRGLEGSAPIRAARAPLSLLLALALATAPLAAFADEAVSGSADGAADAAEQASEEEAAVAQQVSYSGSHDGAIATSLDVIFANDLSLSVSAPDTSALLAMKTGLIVANALDIQARGAAGAGARAVDGGGVSIANSTMLTTKADSSILQSSGTIEADNVMGSAARSRLAEVEGAHAILLANSSLASGTASSSSTGGADYGVLIYRPTAKEDADDADEAALFQAVDSSLADGAPAGSLFYITNTTAKVVLDDVDLSFDSSAVKLLTVSGNDGDWGAAGKNGATATFTGIGQDFTGDILVDSISSLDFYLLDGSQWKGASSIAANSAGTDLATNITVNIDSTSGWTVSEDATVSYLNIEKGGALVDTKGKSVMIVDADGNTLVDGASNVKVTVNGEFSTIVKTTDANKVEDAAIDRAAFDAEFGTETAFGTNGTDAEAADAEYLKQLITDWFENL